MDSAKVRIRYEATGDVRPPREGEWFRGYDGHERLARFDFTAQSFPILRMIVTQEPLSAEELQQLTEGR